MDCRVANCSRLVSYLLRSFCWCKYCVIVQVMILVDQLTVMLPLMSAFTGENVVALSMSNEIRAVR